MSSISVPWGGKNKNPVSRELLYRQQPVSGVGVMNDKCSAQRQRCVYLLMTRCFPCTGHHAEGASAAVEAGASAKKEQLAPIYAQLKADLMDSRGSVDVFV